MEHLFDGMLNLLRASPNYWIPCPDSYRDGRAKKYDSVAQLVEQYTFNVWVLGSNPSGITKNLQMLEVFVFYIEFDL